MRKGTWEGGWGIDIEDPRLTRWRAQVREEWDAGMGKKGRARQGQSGKYERGLDLTQGQEGIILGQYQ